jgi:hypothetical protein
MNDTRTLIRSTSSGSLSSSLRGEDEEGEVEGEADGVDAATDAVGDRDEGELAAWDMPLVANKRRGAHVVPRSVEFSAVPPSLLSLRAPARKAPLEAYAAARADEDEEAWKRMRISSYEGVEPDPTRNYRAIIKIYK